MSERDPTAQTRAHIEQHGWSVIGVSPRAGEGGEQFSYTVGFLDTLGHPEVLLAGLPRAQAGAVLNAVGDAIRAGRAFRAEDMDREIVGSLPLVFTLLPVDSYYDDLGQVLRWRGSDPLFPALQCVWPDKASRFPWAGGRTPGQSVREDVWWEVAAAGETGPPWDAARAAVAASLVATCRLHDLDPEAYVARASTRRGAAPSVAFLATLAARAESARARSPREVFGDAHDVLLPGFVDMLLEGEDAEPELARLFARHLAMRRAGTL